MTAGEACERAAPEAAGGVWGWQRRGCGCHADCGAPAPHDRHVPRCAARASDEGVGLPLVVCMHACVHGWLDISRAQAGFVLLLHTARSCQGARRGAMCWQCCRRSPRCWCSRTGPTATRSANNHHPLRARHMHPLLHTSCDTMQSLGPSLSAAPTHCSMLRVRTVTGTCQVAVVCRV